MKQINLGNMATADLVERFAEVCTAQDRALLGEKIAEFRKLYAQMDAVEEELKRRGRDARLGLTKLYSHPNMQVRLQAAKCTLAVAPGAARSVIEAIRESSWFPQAGDAGMCLRALDDGVFKPD